MIWSDLVDAKKVNSCIETENMTIDLEKSEVRDLEPKLIKIDGYDDFGELLVYGNPYEVGKELDSHQGDNLYRVKGHSGIISVLNVLKMAGIECSENKIVKHAIDMKCCSYSVFDESEKNGKTDRFERCKLLESFGVECETKEIIDEDSLPAYLNSIASYVEEGKGVIMDVYSRMLYDYNPFGDYAVIHKPDRCITVTGTARNPKNGTLEGLFVCDSVKGDKSIFVSFDKLILGHMHLDTIGKDSANCIVTKNPIR